MKRCFMPLLAATFGALAVSPAFAQSDLVGNWGQRQHEDSLERGGGPDIGEYEGIPINEAARRHGQAWSPSLWSVPEHQCIPHPADYGPNFTGARIWKDVDPVTQETVAYHTNIAWMNPVRTIWMDGRAHPPADALHTWEGFSTGKWEGDMLTVTTTHLKPAYVRRNGLPRSAEATLVEHFIRVGDVLTWVSIISDPAYLSEPYIKSRNFFLDPGFQVTVYPCSTDVEVPRPEGEIPHYMNSQNKGLYEWADAHHIPHTAAMGGVETTYPEYQRQLKNAPAEPQAKAKESAR
jgi:hypothetical protein